MSNRIADGDTPANSANWLFFGRGLVGREGLDLALLSLEASVFSVED
ncbi:hypothetical protein [Shewanella sp. UCD-KL21]|nr:hypothetical protein [Shewanella sp. UCD-KL21]